MRAVGISLVGLIVLAGITLGGWQAGWWFRTQDTNREAQVYEQSYGYQQSHAAALSNQISDIGRIDVQIAGTKDDQQVAMLTAQRNHEISDGCALFAGLTHPNPTLTQWAAIHCANGGN